MPNLNLGLHTLSTQPHFLWITQFPLFTKADEDKEHLAKGRWSATHHPFTAPMLEDLEDLKKGKVDAVRSPFLPDLYGPGPMADDQ
jgi:aspartyl-tRNA synthetase